MNTEDQVAELFKSKLNSKILDLKDKLAEATRNRLAYQQLIVNNSNNLYDNEILKYVKRLNLNLDKLSSVKIDNLYKVNLDEAYLTKNRGINELLKYGDSTDDDNRIILTYYKMFYKYVKLELSIERRLAKFERFNFTKHFIKHLFKEYFKNVGFELLRPNNKEHYSLPNNIIIGLRGKDKRKVGDKYGYKSKVNWGESLRVLKHIAETDAPELYSEYNNGNLSKSEFINAMKPLLYNSETNPNGKKWLVKITNDSNFWLVINTTLSSLKNVRNYAIVPTNYVNNESRSQIDFTNHIETVEEIIVSNRLGFRDKIRAIERFDYNYLLNNFKNDILIN